MDTSTRLPGHGLQSEGKPYERGGDEQDPWVRVGFGPHPGSHIGVALCSCGEASPVLESDGQRKRWHREHKNQVRAGGESR